MNNSAIKITSDARFRLARSLMTNGGSSGDDDDSSLEGAIDIFASLLEECRRSSGETSVDAALCHYEYGNALFRAVVRRTEQHQNSGGSDEANEKDGDKKPAAKPPEAVKSATTGKRSRDDNIAMQSDSVPSNKKIKTAENIENCKDDGDDNGDEEDVSLALEMLSTSFGIFDWHVNDATATTATISEEEREFALSQIPRVLNCIGDIHSHRKQFGNAVDAYCTALPYRENASKKKHHATDNNEEGEGCLSVEELTCQRQLVETYALVAEALLACKEGEDVVCVDDEEQQQQQEDDDAGLKKDEKKAKKSIVLVSARDRIEFAQSHYETAKEKLQEIGTCDLRFVFTISISFVMKEFDRSLT